MKTAKKESVSYAFSYLDVFFLLLAGFVLSLLIYFSSDQAKQKNVLYECVVEVTSVYRSELLHAIPQEGEILFDENKNVIGQVLEVQVLDQNEMSGKTELRLLCLTKGVSVEIGEVFFVETSRSRNSGEVIAVSEYKENETV